MLDSSVSGGSFVHLTLLRTRGTFLSNRIPINTIVMESNRIVSANEGHHRGKGGTLYRTRVRTVSNTYHTLSN